MRQTVRCLVYLDSIVSRTCKDCSGRKIGGSRMIPIRTVNNSNGITDAAASRLEIPKTTGVIKRNKTARSRCGKKL